MSEMIETATPQDDAEGGTARMNMIQAINSAMEVVMARDPDVIVMGEDVGYFG
ncbi:MAG: alpha-ketoacid dehydrogenase subunit beta, partial [Pseudomonadota bacterium]